MGISDKFFRIKNGVSTGDLVILDGPAKVAGYSYFVVGGGPDDDLLLAKVTAPALVAGEKGIVYSTNKGATWTNCVVGDRTSIYPPSVYFNTSTKQWVMHTPTVDGSAYQVYFSDDGITWTAPVPILKDGAAFKLTSLVVHPDGSYALNQRTSGITTFIDKSTDGIAWTSSVFTQPTPTFVRVTLGSLWVEDMGMWLLNVVHINNNAIGTYGQSLMVSPDGVAWTVLDDSGYKPLFDGQIGKPVYKTGRSGEGFSMYLMSGDTLLAGNFSPSRSWTVHTKDFVSWERVDDVRPTDFLGYDRAGESKYLVYDTSLTYSRDGRHWASVALPEGYGAAGLGTAYGNTVYINGPNYTAALELPVENLLDKHFPAPPAALTWEDTATGDFGTSTSFSSFSPEFKGMVFGATTGDLTKSLWRSVNGDVWELVDIPPAQLADNNPRLYVVGDTLVFSRYKTASFDTELFLSTDGFNWSGSLVPTLDGAATPNVFIVAGGGENLVADTPTYALCYSQNGVDFFTAAFAAASPEDAAEVAFETATMWDGGRYLIAMPRINDQTLEVLSCPIYESTDGTSWAYTGANTGQLVPAISACSNGVYLGVTLDFSGGRPTLSDISVSVDLQNWDVCHSTAGEGFSSAIPSVKLGASYLCSDYYSGLIVRGEGTQLTITPAADRPHSTGPIGVLKSRAFQAQSLAAGGGMLTLADIDPLPAASTVQHTSRPANYDTAEFFSVAKSPTTGRLVASIRTSAGAPYPMPSDLLYSDDDGSTWTPSNRAMFSKNSSYVFADNEGVFYSRCYIDDISSDVTFMYSLDGVDWSVFIPTVNGMQSTWFWPYYYYEGKYYIDTDFGMVVSPSVRAATGVVRSMDDVLPVNVGEVGLLIDAETGYWNSSSYSTKHNKYVNIWVQYDLGWNTILFSLVYLGDSYLDSGSDPLVIYGYAVYTAGEVVTGTNIVLANYDYDTNTELVYVSTDAEHWVKAVHNDYSEGGTASRYLKQLESGSYVYVGVDHNLYSMDGLVWTSIPNSTFSAGSSAARISGEKLYFPGGAVAPGNTVSTVDFSNN